MEGNPQLRHQFRTCSVLQQLFRRYEFLKLRNGQQSIPGSEFLIFDVVSRMIFGRHAWLAVIYWSFSAAQYIIFTCCKLQVQIQVKLSQAKDLTAEQRNKTKIALEMFKLWSWGSSNSKLRQSFKIKIKLALKLKSWENGMFAKVCVLVTVWIFQWCWLLYPHGIKHIKGFLSWL